MRVTFLSSSLPLVKTLSKSEDKIIKSPYPQVADFTSHTHDVNTIDEFYAHLTDHALLKHCLLKGTIVKEINNERRAGLTRPTDTTKWMCMDIDGLNISSAEEFITACLPKEFHEVSYIEQLSASAGFNSTYSTHLFFLLNDAVPAATLKLWLQLTNFRSKRLQDQLELNATGLSLKYKLDVTTCQNDKLLYIAPPTLIDLDDPVPERIRLISKSSDKVDYDFSHVNAQTCRTLTDRHVELLREIHFPGEKSKRAKYRTVDNIDVLLNPDPFVMCDTPFEERGFVYLPINPNNRHSYYHPADKPEYIFNFCGDPVVRTKDVLPEYWEFIQSQKITQSPDPETQVFVFREKVQDQFYTTELTPEGWKFFAIANKDRAKGFLANYGLDLPDPIPDYRMVFAPTEKFDIDEDKRLINTFQPTTYMQYATSAPPVYEIPPTVHKLILSAAGGDQEAFNYFINWLAYIFQTKKKTMTAWLFQGVQGTGKGITFHRIIKPLFGEHAQSVMASSFADNFNAWIENTLIILVDEADESVTHKPEIEQKIKHLITEPETPIRRMRANQYTVPNYANLIFATNSLGAIKLAPHDRRFNIAPRQETPLNPDDHELDALKDELPAFACFLNHYDVDVYKATHCLQNNAKRISLLDSQNTIELLAESLKSGDFEYIAESYFDNSTLRTVDAHETYKKAIREIANFITEKGLNQPQEISRETLQSIYTYLQSSETSSTKFTRIMRKHSINYERKNISGVKTPVFTITWKKGLQSAIAIVESSKSSRMRSIK